ncbi:hypothetical protein AMTR_s00085p00101970 [Amborella trichopoda]|uniref:Leucine-rich repeat-containing N-terminal plant-type domain-containing protein n=1 Tax=Amborella trichopoda TaxID=13333 RepID=W1P4Y7_AMBTC|nr:hypothetical protein AMTR_s00085p00101970 [Amborella trichopoda]
MSPSRILDHDSNDFFGPLPTNMGSMLPNFEELSWANKLSGPIPSSLHNASKLTVLDLGENQFNGPLPTSLGHLTVLKELYLLDNHIENKPGSPSLSFIDSLTNCTFLEVIELDNNPIAAFLPNSIGNLSNNLKSFTICGCYIEGSIPVSIGNLQNLRYLTMNFVGQLITSTSQTELVALVLFTRNPIRWVAGYNQSFEFVTRMCHKEFSSRMQNAAKETPPELGKDYYCMFQLDFKSLVLQFTPNGDLESCCSLKMKHIVD